MLLVSHYAVGISPGSLVAETARVFEINRMSDNIRDLLTGTYKKLVREKKLVYNNGIVTNPSLRTEN